MADAPDDNPFQSLYRRFRPATFGQVRGQDHVVLALRNAVRDQRVAHAYLFSGPRGTGKTSTARILAKALNCTDLRDGEPCGVCASCTEITKGTSLDVHELDAASNNGVDAMRDLVSRAALGTPGRQKVYIVDEVHMLSTAASNALLKTLEEPPAHVVFVLATTDPQKVLPTIKSRTQHFEFHLLGPETLGELLDQVRQDAHLDVPDEALDLAVRRARGSARDALSVLDQVVASESVDDDLPELDEVVEALADRDVARALVALARLTSSGFSPQQLAVDLVDYLRQGFLTLVAPDLVAVSSAERQALTGRAERVGLAALVRGMELLGQTQVSMRDAPDPRVNLEVALVRLAHPDADSSPEALLIRIERLEAAVRRSGASGPASGPPAATATATRTPGPTPAPFEAPQDNAGPDSARPDSAGPDNAGPDSPAQPDDAIDGPVQPPKKTVGALRRRPLPQADGDEPQPPAESSVATTGGVSDALPSAPGPTTPEPTVTSPPESGGDDLPLPTRDQLVQAWGDHIIGSLRPKAKALFQAGRFVGVEGGRAVFALPNEIHRDRCEEVREEIEGALSAQFGRAVGLSLVVDTGIRPAAEGTNPATAGGSNDPAGSGPGGISRIGASEGAETPATNPDDPVDLSSFDESELGEIVNVDNSAEARVLQAFPGAEEVS